VWTRQREICIYKFRWNVSTVRYRFVSLFCVLFNSCSDTSFLLTCDNATSIIITKSYGPGNGEVVNESSPLPESTMASPRSLRLVKAEENVLSGNGCVLRLAGLYTLDRGAHNYWLEKSGGIVKGSKDGIINLLHYDDAAGACLAALVTENDVRGQIFLISDGNPTTRIGICESALKAKRYGGLEMPSFGADDDATAGKGKIYDGTFTNSFLKWKPRYESFDKFMTSSQ